MERTIRKVEMPVPVQPRLKRVAAYARVSSGKDAMLHSLSAQVSFYSQLIQNHDGWQYCGVFSDEAYHVLDAHEPIIDMALFEAVQRESDARAAHFVKGPTVATYPFTGKVECLGCGKHYRRKVTAVRAVWICSTFNAKGKASCPTSKQIPEETLMAITAQVLGLTAFDEHVFTATIEKIQADANNSLRYIFRDGRSIDTTWADRSRAESWTPEMKEAARATALQRRKNT